jgi:hypothetical protein
MLGVVTLRSLTREKDIRARQRRTGVDAIPQINCESEIASPKRVTHLSASFGIDVGLYDDMHGVDACVFEPCRGAPEEVPVALEEPKRGVTETAGNWEPFGGPHAVESAGS